MAKQTEQAIADALKTLLAKKPLSKITISDIAGECGVNRMTFYYHYHDVYELLEHICDDCFRRAMEGKRSINNWQDGIKALMDSMREDKAFFMGVYHSIEMEQINDYIYRAISSVLREGSREVPVPEGVTDEDVQFIIDFYAYAFCGLLTRWIRDGMTEDSDELVDRMAKVGKDGFSRAFEAFSKG